MKWLVFIAIAAGILIIFGATYAISNALDKRGAPKYKTSAPDDDPKFLRDLAEKLKQQDATPPAGEGQKPTGDNPVDENPADENPEGKDAREQ